MCKSCNYSQRLIKFGSHDYRSGDKVRFGKDGPEYEVFTIMEFDDPEMWLIPVDAEWDKELREHVIDGKPVEIIRIRESTYYAHGGK